VQRWMLEVIAYFDQLGCLVITPLIPIILWLILDRAFLRQLWVEMVLVGAAEAGKDGESR
jgi:hypothetical protein